MGLTKNEILQIAHLDLIKLRQGTGRKSEEEILGFVWDQALEAGKLDGGDAGYMTGLADARAEQHTQLELPLTYMGYLGGSRELAAYIDELAQGNHD